MFSHQKEVWVSLTASDVTLKQISTLAQLNIIFEYWNENTGQRDVWLRIPFVARTVCYEEQGWKGKQLFVQVVYTIAENV